MKKVFAVIALLVVLAMPVNAQGLDFLANLMKAVVREFGIESVIRVLEDLGYIGDGEVAITENATEVSQDNASELTVRSPLWDDAEGEETLAFMVVSDDPHCYSFIEWARDTDNTVAERMRWRQEFINKCIGR